MPAAISTTVSLGSVVTPATLESVGRTGCILAKEEFAALANLVSTSCSMDNECTISSYQTPVKSLTSYACAAAMHTREVKEIRALSTRFRNKWLRLQFPHDFSLALPVPIVFISQY